MTFHNVDISRFLKITFIVNTWVQLSETFRYLVFVVPKMQIEGVETTAIGPMVLTIWFLWGTFLTTLTVFMFWLQAQVLGTGLKTIFFSATVSWLFFFVLFWVGSANMGTAKWSLLYIALPLSWLELFVATLIAAKMSSKKKKTLVV